MSNTAAAAVDKSLHAIADSILRSKHDISLLLVIKNVIPRREECCKRLWSAIIASHLQIDDDACNFAWRRSDAYQEILANSKHELLTSIK